jgi:hypothetical protein
MPTDVCSSLPSAALLLTYSGMSEARKDGAEPAHKFANMSINTKSPEHGSRPAQPPRPVQQPVEEEEEDDAEEEDENDPFADRNAVATPRVERSEPVWYVYHFCLYLMKELTNVVFLGRKFELM